MLSRRSKMNSINHSMNLGRNDLVNKCAQMRNNSRKDVGSCLSKMSLLVGKNPSYIFPTMGNSVIRYTSLREISNYNMSDSVHIWSPSSYKSLQTVACNGRPKSPPRHPLSSECFEVVESVLQPIGEAHVSTNVSKMMGHLCGRGIWHLGSSPITSWRVVAIGDSMTTPFCPKS